MYIGSAAPFRSGWFGGAAGLVGGLLAGSMLGVGGWLAEDAAGFEDRSERDRYAQDW